MQTLKIIAKVSALAGALLASGAHAAVIISEANPAGSGFATYAADWFELTNTGSSAIDISGWKVDDNSNAFGSALALRGITSIGAGESVIFIESNTSGSNDASINDAFRTAWFGSNAPANLLIGNYGGSGIGLSTGGDALNIYTGGGSLVTRILFGSSTDGYTFDNAAGINNANVSTLSAININGAFRSADGKEVGSPGAVPVPAALPLLMSALTFIGVVGRKRRTA